MDAADLAGWRHRLCRQTHQVAAGDEPTIEALNSIGVDVSGVGNHEFDEGVDELRGMQYGNQRGGDGCHPVDGARTARRSGLVGNANVAFIGLTFEGTPTVVTPSAIEGLGPASRRTDSTTRGARPWCR
jgi:hypothetical protein